MGDMADYYDDRDSDVGFGYGGMNPGLEHRTSPYRDRTHNQNRTSPRPRRANNWNQKETRTMTAPKRKNPALVRLEAELDSNLGLQTALAAREQELREQIRKADIPAEPDPHLYGDMFLAEIQFTAGGTIYQYLLMRSGKRWFTTGTKDEQKVFASWEKLCEWLNSTYWHAPLSSLRIDQPRAVGTEHTLKAPF